uniref:Nucleoporin Nup54 alpha-helical domain-containing protein n=1 Tax=Auxenochlorella protothecoides TaxID=3075 RepID=A0A1D1ZZ15_AUXPR
MAFSFNSTPASTTAFSFGGGAPVTQRTGSAPLFGGASSGAAVTPSLFGAAPSPATPAGGFSFGFGAASTPAAATGTGATSAPLFGAGGGGTFGASSTPSLFGASSTPSLFGASSTPSLFGASSTPSLFGASSTPSLFGAGAPPPTAFGGAPAGTLSLFGAGAQQQQQQQQAVPYATPDLGAVRELEALRDAFLPGTPRSRFQHLFLNVVEDPAARVRPTGVDELAWRAALRAAGGPDNPDRLWPVVAAGGRELVARRAAQDAALAEHVARLDALRAVLSSVAGRARGVVEEGLEGARGAHLAQSRALLRVARSVDALEGRFAAATGQGPAPAAAGAGLDALAARLGEAEAALAPVPGGLAARLAEAGAAAALAGPAQGAPPPALDDDALADVYGLLSQQTAALAGVQAVLRRAERDLEVLEGLAAAG